MKISEKVGLYISMRNDIAVLKSEFKEAESVIKTEMLKLEVDILAAADEMGVESFKTENGTAYQVVKKYTAIFDREMLIKYVKESDDFAVFTNHISKNHILELMDDGLDPLDVGVTYSEERSINVRKS